ncbi:hypothetical protein L596_007218 [Steinernema carpocapsae]|uniref:DNA polymerase epsilon catalytic subunit n=1 Tax=Steinernema carpocapsae TaxID=34508 RepID=A0A4U5P9B4_STECR|nr:hypothetical protein L596_007218 [Steinernema carpocapsae]
MDPNGENAQPETDRNYLERVRLIEQREKIDLKFKYERYTDSAAIDAWLVNVQPSEIIDEQTKMIISVVDFYFLQENGSRFKISYPSRPYLYLATTDGYELAISSYLSRKYTGMTGVELITKEDLDLKNHLSGLQRTYIKMSFPSTVELQKFKRELMPMVKRNQEILKNATDYKTMLAEHLGARREDKEVELLEQIIDIREHDVPYHMRVCIDEKIFCGLWYTAVGRDTNRRPSITRNANLIDQPDPCVLAYDIETTKLPLKFPDRAIDEIMMISYMIDGEGYLIINRSIVSADVEDFEYTPKPEFPGRFTVLNEKDEKATIIAFFDHIQRVCPSIMVTYNGDFFDWPFVEARAAHHGIDMFDDIGFAKDSQDEYKSSNCIHMDAFRWVKRDSYLPMGSQNLKACTRAKLRYDPVELDPEEMCAKARDDPQMLANYSVSDAVATYYLYMKYVHPFIFALCTIIPLGPDDVLRKGSGTLCEALLMVEAFHNNIIFPNKQISGERKITKNGHTIVSETYVGGHVEALESGVFRADIPVRFRLVPSALLQLKQEARKTFTDALTHEMQVPIESVVNFDEKVKEVEDSLESLKENSSRLENPKIYHLDVGAMYPNIILTNRLQPPAMVDEETCMSCVYNTEDAKCKRNMTWEWRGELVPATRGEYDRIVQQLEKEKFGKPPKPFHSLPKEEQAKIEKQRIQDYCRRAYGRLHITQNEFRSTRICQRENAFYVDTVRAFRDRRYDYKALLKKAKGKLLEVAPDNVNGIKSAQARIVLYESLQLAHKCILNSFYGYAMRKGSRWFSMEMAGIVCHTGANIITEARKLVEQIGKPLELDTDGIWCLLPNSFPEDVDFVTDKGKKVTVSYPGAMLNSLVREKFTNDQYHTLDETVEGGLRITSENSIFFEVDGPYLAMILPASKEEGKKLKKRYAVFNFDGSLAELKGFELKRRGELSIIKEFQESVFSEFLKGSTLVDVYANVAKVADYWLDVLFSKGVDLRDEDVFGYIAEDRSMSRKLEDYGSQKSTSISTAKRLAEFLGDDMVKDAGLACRFIISKNPRDAPVTERAIPLAIFQADRKVTAEYLRRWTKDSFLTKDNINIRDIIDWDYYIERVGSTIQKIITIPAALQGVANPVPRLPHPDWLQNKKREKIEAATQPRITDIFKKRCNVDMEDSVLAPLSASDRLNRKRGPDGGGNENSQLSEVKRHKTTDSQVAINKSTKGQNSGSAPLVKKTIAKDGVTAWIKFLQQKWTRERKQANQEQKNALDALRLAKRITGTARMDSMLGAHRVTKKTNFFEILEIAETAIPGVFTLWILSNGIMRRAELNVSRTYYVNKRREDLKTRGIKIEKKLPRMKPSLYLYEYKVDEKDYESYASLVESELCASLIEGIYETKVPLLFKSLVQMGCMCHLRGNSVSQNSNSFSLENFERVPLSDSASYLEDHPVRMCFFYEYTYKKRTVAAILSPANAMGHFFVVNPVNVEIPNLTNVYAYEYQKFIDRETDTAARHPKCASMSFSVSQLRGDSDLKKELVKVMKSYKLLDSGPTVVTVVSNTTRKKLHERFPTLANFPNVRLPVKEADGTMMNTISWARDITKRVVQHYFNSFTYFQSYVNTARYVGIPIGNVPEDMASLASDIFYARDLLSSGYVLWASESALPDLGGKELDDCRLANDWDMISFRPQTGFIVNKETFEFSVVAELDIGAIAVSALIQKAKIAEAEGTSDTVGFITGDQLAVDAIAGNKKDIATYDEAASVNPSVQVLRKMLLDCVREIHSNQNDIADKIVANAHRWIRNPHSLLYDPAICNAVSILMKKLCLLLVSEVNRIGGKVIHCTYTRLIFSTGKANLSLAKPFVNSLIQTLNTNQVFAGVQFKVTHYWDLFAWIDPLNFAALQFGADGNEVEILRSEWAMAEYLHDNVACKEIFDKFVLGYFISVTRKAREKIVGEKLIDFCEKLISTDLSPGLFNVTSKLMHELREDRPPERLPPGFIDEAALTNWSMPLQLTKLVCKVLSLDTKMADRMETLRCQLMRILSIEESSAAATWKPPIATCMLTHLFCEHCGQSGEVDVCQMPSLFDDEEENEKYSAFGCSSCCHPYTKRVIERELIWRLNRLIGAYTVQDHRCSKCGSIRQDQMAMYCDCSGRFLNTIAYEDMEMHLKIINRIAEQNELKKLYKASTWILGAEFPKKVAS